MPSLKEQYPWISSPIVANAPMTGFAGSQLASAVSQAGGIGMVGGISVDSIRSDMKAISDEFKSNPQHSSSNVLPVGLGFLPFVHKLGDMVSLLMDYRPAILWLFAAKELEQYTEWADSLRMVSPYSKIWIQVGSVAAALYVAEHARPDVIVMQGADAGGHGFEKGAGIISLIPETTDAFEREGYSHIPLFAAGGISDGRGVAAALALGAKGAVLGTRFLASKECIVHPNYQAAVLEAHDGGQITTRSKLFDQLNGPNIWPENYDGRSLMIQSHKDFSSGVSLEEIQKLHKEAVGKEDKGYSSGLQGRAVIWAGTGVGLVNQVESAKDIVESVRRKAASIIS